MSDADIVEKTILLAARLLERTQGKEIDWVSIPELNHAYDFDSPSGASVRIASADNDDQAPFHLYVFNSTADVVASLRTQWFFDESTDEHTPATWNEVLEDLYAATRRRSLRSEEVLDQILDEL